jgi:hypothetical protein
VSMCTDFCGWPAVWLRPVLTLDLSGFASRRQSSHEGRNLCQTFTGDSW